MPTCEGRNRYNSGMSLTLLAPCSLSHAAAQLARQRVRLPALEALLASATIDVVDQSVDDALGAMLGVRGELSLPVAPLRLAADGFDRVRDDAYWLCADPVTTALLIDNIRITGRCVDLTRS